MPTVIDSLVVELGLDPKQFSSKAKEAINDLKKMEDVNDKRSKGIQEGTKKETEALRGLSTVAIELFAIFTGATGIAEFASKTILAGASVGRLSRAIGVSSQEIQKYQGIAAIYGSTAEAMANSFQSMANTFTAWTHGGLEAAPILQRLQLIQTRAQELDRANARIFNPRGTKDEYFKDLAANLKIIHDLDPDKNFASYLAGGIPGMDAGQFDMLIQGAQKLAAAMKEIHVLTDAEVEAAGRLDREWNSLVGNITNWAKSNILRTLQNDERDLKSAAVFIDRWFGTNFSKGAETVATSSAASSGTMSDAETEAFIRQAAVKRGQNPDVWVQTWSGEGRKKYTGDLDATGTPTSFGPLQLHFAGVGRNTAEGLGPIFQKQTGLDPRDPSTMRQQIEWSMDWARTHGMSDWHGWKGGQFANLQGGGSSTSVSISGPITINAGPNASAVDIAARLRDLGIKHATESNLSAVGGQ